MMISVVFCSFNSSVVKQKISIVKRALRAKIECRRRIFSHRIIYSWTDYIGSLPNCCLQDIGFSHRNAKATYYKQMHAFRVVTANYSLTHTVPVCVWMCHSSQFFCCKRSRARAFCLIAFEQPLIFHAAFIRNKCSDICIFGSSQWQQSREWRTENSSKIW